jgi:hypothetical protein
MIFSSGGNASKRVEVGGHFDGASNGQSSGAPTSPQSTWAKRKMLAERDRDGVGQIENSSNGQIQCAHPARDTKDGERVHMSAASNGHLHAASSPSPSMLGHNSKTKVARGPAFDPDKMRKSQAGVRNIIAKALADTWKLSDGRLVCKMPLRELACYKKDGVVCTAILETVTNKYPNADDSMN